MKRLVLGMLAAAVIAAAGPANAVKVHDPVGVLSDTDGNAGYLEVDESDGAVRVCNENERTSLGDDATGYAWVNPDGESTPPTYGNQRVGFGDADGEDAGHPNDCP